MAALDLGRVAAGLRELVPALLDPYQTPGYLIGLADLSDSRLLPFGVANLNSGAPMRSDTLFCAGSITKVMTAQLLLGYVAAGHVSLDTHVIEVLPDFHLADQATAASMTLRQLINHSNGIDADLLMPDAETGPGAVKSYVDALRGRGNLFEPGQAVHYSNPGFCIAARVLEVLGAQPYNRLLESELFAPCGMSLSCTSAAQAILRSTAIGTFPGPDGPRPATIFSQVPAAAGAGSTAVSCLADLLELGRVHLRLGKGAAGEQLLPETLARLMQSGEHDSGLPDPAPVGLGWWLAPLGAGRVAWHGGGSAGGSAMLVLFPAHKLVVAAYANSAAGPRMHDAVMRLIVEEGLGEALGRPWQAGSPSDPEDVAGDYVSWQALQRVAVSGEGVQLQVDIRPEDETQARTLARHLGTLEVPAVEYRPLNARTYIQQGLDERLAAGLWGRTQLLSFTRAEDAPGSGLYSRTRFARRQPGSGS